MHWGKRPMVLSEHHGYYSTDSEQMWGFSTAHKDTISHNYVDHTVFL